jgi:hypothetical protein
VGVLAERNVAAAAQQASPVAPHLVCDLRRARPLVIDEPRRVEPGLLLRLESDIGPRLVRMACQEQPLRDSEARVVTGEVERIRE